MRYRDETAKQQAMGLAGSPEPRNQVEDLMRENEMLRNRLQEQGQELLTLYRRLYGTEQREGF